jgi:XRE family transcriptional regulator, regulator of sulfur utilization
MTIGDKIADLRTRKGLTQEDLADLAGVTVRTIQRIENGSTSPRPYTLRALAKALGTAPESLAIDDPPAPKESLPDRQGENQDNLYLLNLSSFTYLVIPFVHALVPYIIWRRHRTQLYVSGKRIILNQLKWTIALWGLLLLALVYNLLLARYSGPPAYPYMVNYIWIIVFMYGINAVIIGRTAYFIRSGRFPV